MRDATTVLEIIRDCIAITINTGKPDATETGTSGLGRGRWKRATTAPRWRPTSLHAGFCGSPGVRSPRATRQDGRRRGSYPHIAFTFLGYTFRPRGVRTKTGTMMTGFNPAISRDALTKDRGTRAVLAAAPAHRSLRSGPRTRVGFQNVGLSL
jgi:hypothetical protein